MWKKKAPDNADLNYWRGLIDTRLGNLETLCQQMNTNLSTLNTFLTRALVIVSIVVAVVGFVLYIVFPRVLDILLRAPGGLPKP